MPDAVAWWGAVTGTTGALIAGRQELRGRRLRVRVDHGWRYLLAEDDPPLMLDMLVYVMVTNTGGRKVPVQHVGWEWLVDSGERTTQGGTVWHAHRAEMPLREPVLLEPDGVPFKEQARVGQLLQLVDPLDDEVRPIAFTGGGNIAWQGPSGPLAQSLPPQWSEEYVRQRFAELRDQAKRPTATREGLYSLEPLWIEEEGSTSDQPRRNRPA